MTIRNNEEKKMFENAIDRCERTVWLITMDGNQIDLKTPDGLSQGIAIMENAKGYEEPELFTTCVEDEMQIFEFLDECRKAA